MQIHTENCIYDSELSTGLRVPLNSAALAPAPGTQARARDRAGGARRPRNVSDRRIARSRSRVAVQRDDEDAVGSDGSRCDDHAGVWTRLDDHPQAKEHGRRQHRTMERHGEAHASPRFCGRVPAPVQALIANTWM